MRSPNCEPIEPLLPAYALDALDDDDRTAVEMHLKGCESCRAQYTELLETMARIAKSSPQHIPPLTVEQRLAAYVGANGSGSLQRLAVWLRGLFGSPRRWMPMTSAAFAAAVIVIGGLATEVGRLSIQKVALTTRLAQQQQAVMQYAQECTNKTMLNGTALAAGATALVRFTPTEHLGVLEVNGLASLSAAQTYQLWLIDSGGGYENGGLFQVPAAPNDQIAILIIAPRNFKDYARFGISIEPSTGSLHPTSPLALGSL